MRTVKTRGETHPNFAKPANWDDELDGVCHAISARCESYGQRGLLNVISTWKPDAAELAHLNRGGVIELSQVGGMLPSAMHVVDPVEPPPIADPKSITINEHAHGDDSHGQ
jgi:hypothetical protein